MKKLTRMKHLTVVAAAVLTMSALLQGCAGKTENVATGQTGAEVSVQETEAGREAAAENETETEKETETTAEGITFTDDLGRTVTVKSHERVVTMIGSFTDTWILAGGNVV